MVGFYANKVMTERKIGEASSRARAIVEEAEREAKAIKKEALSEARAEANRIKQEAERDIREKRNEVQRMERRLEQKEDALTKKLEGLSRKEEELRQRQEELDRLRDEAMARLQEIAGLTAEQARELLLKELEVEVQHRAGLLIKSYEEKIRREAERRAREILTTAIQRCAVDHTSEMTVSVVALPSDDMKGRIIGREGRNIRAFESITGVDLIVDDTPEAVTLSSFDPVRREVARIALEKLVVDGRIHPARIEEMVERARKEVEKRVEEAGEMALVETGVKSMHPELVSLLGQLSLRTSYGQNALRHSIEVAHLAGMIAAELGLDESVAKRAGLLHDIGKAVDFKVEGPHALIGADIARKYGESPEVVDAISAHHEDVEATTPYAVLVLVADAISASRPGARRESLEAYIKRLEKLESIARAFPGVEKAYAIQAGREIRIMVDPGVLDDAAACKLAYDVARKIEEELKYPGQVKVTVVRETRATEYAK